MPDSIGGYRILGKLGEGGMGVVYEAEQQEPRRRVALKVIRGGVAVDELQVRMFQREVETLARLKHPDIGAIYESGRTADGLHWFAMELVRGPDLSAYLSLRPKSVTPDELRHRLRLAARIALAVHYAHQRGVIHRDLKPSNIIVTEERSGVSTAGGGGPDVKILDFGLARLTDEDLQLAETLTIAGAIKGTLPYMSPEQARGESAAIDVRTDVYALGVVLYEMLTGQRPYDVARASLLEAVRVICEEPPRSMSVSWSGQRRLDGDIETIVGKALEKDPSRRYGSAAALAEDIERYLNSEPIAARPPSAAYQIRKFTERHRALVLGAAATSLAVLAGLLVSTTLYFRAEREKKSAQQVSRFLASMLEGVGAQVAQGRDTALLREILQKTTERIGTELGGDPEIEANLRSTMGVAYYEVADFAAAEAQYQRALELYTGLRGNSHMDVALQLSNLGLVAEAKSDFPGAEARLRQAVEIARRAGSPADPKIPEFETRLANMIVNQARYDDARVLLEESLARQREIFRGANSDLAVTLNSLGNVYHYQGKLEQAEACYREALAMHREVLGDSHPFVATDLLNIGLLLDKRGNLTEAESALRDALARFRALYPGGNDHTTATLSGLASLLQRAAKYDEAEALAREAVAINEQLFGQRSAVYARSLDALAVLLAAKGEGAEADAAHLRALEIRREIYGPRHPDVASSLNNLGMRKLEAANFTEAEQLLGEAVEIQREASGVDSGAALVFMNNLARAREGRGDLAGAEQLYLEVLERRRAVLGKDSVYVAVTEYWLSRMLRDSGRAGEAEPYQREAAAIMNAALGPAHIQTAIMEIELGEVLTSAGKLDESEALLRSVLERAIASDGAESRKALDARLALGRSLTVAGRPAEALQELDQVLAAPETALSGASRGLARIYHGLALAAAGRAGAGRTELEAVRREFSAKYGPDHRISRIAAREAARLGR
ncbi:MAG: serine/threonine-protein kinase [Acidobacteria bacterium]|jgi:tetratricopeptide (TPR) repeat protein/tRNA A-37 threonylcarbamoyl transferase component Bud32|nr:serine/threonine-protein kinase [Acidobacteriota bacterium]